MLRTILTEKLNIIHPIVQGGMHYVGYAPLAAAVSNAGGLGIITALTQPSASKLREEIRMCKTLTNKPFGTSCILNSLVIALYRSELNVVANASTTRL